MKLFRPLAWLVGIMTAALAVLAGVLLITGCAAFGAQPEGERLARLQPSPEWHGDHFENPQPQWRDLRSALLQLVTGKTTPGVEPDSPIAVVHSDPTTFATPPPSGLRVTWFGHSSALVEMDGSRVLIDPFWSERPSPFSWAGPKRWYPPPIALDQLPAIDAVLISHDHYDHLDQVTLMALAATGSTVFVVPPGVGAHLARWGIAESRIIELDWWQSTQVGALQLVATPARHASGRKSTSSNQTLWAGYAMVGPTHRTWYSGDTGFHGDLEKIGQRLGPFDVTLIEAGQYDANWPDAHLGPELAVEAHRQVRGKVMIPVHWGLVKLANHAWTEPAERVLAAARCHGVEVLVPRPGEGVEPTGHPRIAAWWPVQRWQSASERPIVGTRNGLPTDRLTVPACLNPKAS